ncbi:hypothetical protein LIER_30227 [Lithospermum erythrorhizon]|uniref:Uncharacterized protein n=1 Tax=Lithospermum erythrorhizon TaxID=34254 RepID=A0AAV3RNR8_LITER
MIAQYVFLIKTTKLSSCSFFCQARIGQYFLDLVYSLYINMEHKTSNHFLVLVVLFYLVASSSAFHLSTGNRKLLNDNEASSQEFFFQEDAANEKVLQEFIERRMLIELQDYPGTGANDRHNP